MAASRAGGFDVLLVSWDGGGNVPPMLALGKRLRSRGHRARLLGPATLEARAAAAGVELLTFPGEPSWVARRDRAIEDDLLGYVHHVAGPEMADGLLEVVEGERPSALVIDAMAIAALCAAERLDVPTAVLVHTRYRYFASEVGARAWERGLGLINQTRSRLELEPLEAGPGPHAKLWARAGDVLVACPRELEGPGPALPAAVRHIGPILDPEPEPVPPGVAEFVGGGSAPLVVVSLSTTYMHHEQLLARIVEALEGSGVRSVITLGRVLDAAAVRAPAGGIVCDWVAHESLLEHADAVITHAGLGTTLCALSAGVPLVCVPIDRDQPATAARVAALGAGVALQPEAGGDRIRDALHTVLSDPAFRRAAQKLSRRIAGLGRGERAVQAVEALARDGSRAPLRPAGTPLEPAGTPLEPAGTPLEPAGTPLEPAIDR